MDEDKKYSEWCPLCGGDVVMEELPPEEDYDIPVG
jgi:hypothetical protein